MSFLSNELSLSDSTNEEIANLAVFAELGQNYDHVYQLVSIILDRKLKSHEDLSFLERNLYGNAVIKLMIQKKQTLNKMIQAAMTHGGMKIFKKQLVMNQICV